MNRLFTRVGLVMVSFTLFVKADEGCKADEILYRYGGYEYAKRMIGEEKLGAVLAEPSFPDRSKYSDYEWAVALQRFWMKKGLADGGQLEKMYFLQEEEGLKKALATIKDSLLRVARGAEPEQFISCYALQITYPLLRIIDDRSSFRTVLTDRLLTDALFWRGAKPKYDSGAKLLVTSLNMLVVANRIVLRRIETGALPATIEEVETGDEATVDAWGHRLMYVQQDDRWLIKSLNSKGVDDGFDFDNHWPFVMGRHNIVFSSTTSRLLLELLEKGVTSFRGGHIRLNRETGAMQTPPLPEKR